MTEPLEPARHLTGDEPTPECNDEPKLTADEWAYVQAMTTDGGES